MGHIEITRHWDEERHLVLSIEDVRLSERRRRKRQDSECHPVLLGWQHCFTKKLDKCPYCGKAPRLLALWRPEYGWDYKYVCSDGYLDCGDWYEQLSRAGLDWNYRVRETQGAPHKHVRHIRVKCDAYGRER